MSSLEAMLEALPVYFQYVYEQAAHVKIDMLPIGVNLGCSESLICVVFGWLSTTGVL